MYTKPKRKDPKFISKATTPEALEYWIKLIVEGYMRLYENQGFTESQVVTDYNEQYHEENNTAIAYVNDLRPDIDIDGKRAPEVYAEYEIWCQENGENLQSAKLFKQTVYDIHGFSIKAKKINGKTQRVYVLGE